VTHRNLPPDRPEGWKQHPRFTLYEVSDKGRHRRDGRVLTARVHRRTGYAVMDFRTADGQKFTVGAHRAVLETFAGPCPPGQETRHGRYRPLVNWHPENLCWGTKQENMADKPVNGGGPPSFPCRNAVTCGNMVMNEGRRCRPCVMRAGQIIAAMINAGLPLHVAADRMDYESADWAWKLACDFGDPPPRVTKRQASRQSPTVRQRLAITLRDRRSNGWGDAA